MARFKLLQRLLKVELWFNKDISVVSLSNCLLASPQQ